ncbi:MAG: hypothetical protein FWC41_09545 [Firmicutes bacterium]|nr:hypothetical protein [Bacillota bacterium]
MSRLIDAISKVHLANLELVSVVAEYEREFQTYLEIKPPKIEINPKAIKKAIKQMEKKGKKK